MPITGVNLGVVNSELTVWAEMFIWVSHDFMYL